MRNDWRVLVVSFAMVGALQGCVEPPAAMRSIQTANPGYTVDLLFTHDGCSVYRFNDGPHPVYYADCRGSASTSQSVACGRGCVREETVQTTEGGESDGAR